MNLGWLHARQVLVGSLFHMGTFLKTSGFLICVTLVLFPQIFLIEVHHPQQFSEVCHSSRFTPGSAWGKPLQCRESLLDWPYSKQVSWPIYSIFALLLQISTVLHLQTMISVSPTHRNHLTLYFSLPFFSWLIPFILPWLKGEVTTNLRCQVEFTMFGPSNAD